MIRMGEIGDRVREIEKSKRRSSNGSKIARLLAGTVLFGLFCYSLSNESRLQYGHLRGSQDTNYQDGTKTTINLSYDTTILYEDSTGLGYRWNR